MIDTREEILAHLVPLLGNVSGIKNVFRDRGEMKRELLPAIVLLDGRESIRSDILSRKTVRMPPALFLLQTQIWLALEPRDNVDNEKLRGIDAPIGPELSHYRMLILDAVLNDATLVSILTPNGQMEYRGCETDMAIGSSMVGQMMMQFDFTYVLSPSRS